MTTKMGFGVRSKLRTAGRIAVLAGALGSVAFTLYAGRHNGSLVLRGLFVIWVLLPFLALLWADSASKRWTGNCRTALHCLMVLLAPGSIAIYGINAVRPPKMTAAFAFVAFPMVSGALIIVVVLMSVLISRRR